MKKVISIAVMSLVVMSLVGSVFAASVQNAPHGFGFGYCVNNSQNYNDLTDEQKAQITVWQQQMLEQKKQMLARHVEWGWITQVQADERLSWIEEQVANGTYRGHGAMGMHAGNGHGRHGGGCRW